MRSTVGSQKCRVAGPKRKYLSYQKRFSAFAPVRFFYPPTTLNHHIIILSDTQCTHFNSIIKSTALRGMLTAFSRSSAFLKSAILAKGDFIMTLFDQIRSFRRISFLHPLPFLLWAGIR